VYNVSDLIVNNVPIFENYAQIDWTKVFQCVIHMRSEHADTTDAETFAGYFYIRFCVELFDLAPPIPTAISLVPESFTIPGTTGYAIGFPDSTWSKGHMGWAPSNARAVDGSAGWAEKASVVLDTGKWMLDGLFDIAALAAAGDRTPEKDKSSPEPRPSLSLAIWGDRYRVRRGGVLLGTIPVVRAKTGRAVDEFQPTARFLSPECVEVQHLLQYLRCSGDADGWDDDDDEKSTDVRLTSSDAIRGEMSRALRNEPRFVPQTTGDITLSLEGIGNGATSGTRSVLSTQTSTDTGEFLFKWIEAMQLVEPVTCLVNAKCASGETRDITGIASNFILSRLPIEFA
jgi:hypothetical protein